MTVRERGVSGGRARRWRHVNLTRLVDDECPADAASRAAESGLQRGEPESRMANTGIQLPALRAAADAERYAHSA